MSNEIEQWIEDNTQYHESYNCGIEFECIDVEDIHELLKTHVIVPKEEAKAAYDYSFAHAECFMPTKKVAEELSKEMPVMHSLFGEQSK